MRTKLVGGTPPSRFALLLLLLVALIVAACQSAVSGQAVKADDTAASLSQSAPVSPVPTIATTVTDSTADLDPPSSAPSTSRPTSTAPTTLSANDLQLQHDAAFSSMLQMLGRTLKSGDREKFLAPFAPALAGRVRHWFSNTSALGVAAVRFAPSDDYSSGATDSVSSFTRSVVLGIRTPYDDDNTMPGIVYGVTISVSRKAGRPVYTVTSWQPKYLGDPMNCDCTLTVEHTNTTAVVADSSDKDLSFWLDSALDAAAGIAWTHDQMRGSGLIAPKGAVIFLADKPFRWFLNATGPAQSSNVTAALVDSLGQYPGTRYSNQSRIVLMLESADGSIVPNDPQGREYASDVITHESTHQLMNRNSALPSRSETSPPTWAVEGIAVAVETLYRDSLGEAGDIGYPEPNDPKNTDPKWFAANLSDQMPTRSQLYSSSDDPAGSGYYAIAGSVFRYIEREYGYVEMMKIAKQMYAKPAQNPFDYFPDAAHPGSNLPAGAAKSRWKSWFVDHYE